MLVTFTRALLRRLLQAPPMLPAEGPCRKPAGNRMVSRERKKETYPFSDRSFYFHPGPQLQRAAASQGVFACLKLEDRFLVSETEFEKAWFPAAVAPLSPLCSAVQLSWSTLWEGDVAKKHQTWPQLG